MNFLELCQLRDSCRSYDATRLISEEDLNTILEAGRLAPSACNSQPYHLWVCHGKSRDVVANARSMNMNGFISDAPVLIVITESDYNITAALGASVKKQDYRSIDIGILCASLCYAAADRGIENCILGMFDEKRIQEELKTKDRVRLVLALGYGKSEKVIKNKKRKSVEELITKLN